MSPSTDGASVRASRNGQRDTHGPAWLVQASLIARRSLVEGKSKVEIAAETGLSRFKVARVLDEARELGLVRVSISVPGQVDVDLSSTLTERLGLRRAVVVKQVATEDEPLRQALAVTAAELVGEIVEESDVLGLSCSRSVDALTRHLSSLAPCRVVQLTGTLAGAEIASGSVESVRRAAAVGGGRAYPIYAPMIVPDAATACGLATQSEIAPVMAQFGDVTKAIVAVGGWVPGQSTVYGAVSDEDRTSAAAAGAVGEIGGRLFDASGATVETPVGERILGVELDQLRDIDEVLCIAFNRLRAPAVRAAIVGGIVTSLVCDAAMAQALLGTGDGVSSVAMDTVAGGATDVGSGSASDSVNAAGRGG